jgi:hypothetical protein
MAHRIPAARLCHSQDWKGSFQRLGSTTEVEPRFLKTANAPRNLRESYREVACHDARDYEYFG